MNVNLNNEDMARISRELNDIDGKCTEIETIRSALLQDAKESKDLRDLSYRADKHAQKLDTAVFRVRESLKIIRDAFGIAT